MANNNASGLGALGLAAVAAAAGAYYFYGKNGKKHRKHLSSWVVKAKGEVMEQIEQAQKISQKTYNRTVADVLKKYKKLKHVTPAELADVASELRGHWKGIKAEFDRFNSKPASKSR